jgi:hypothetical protein
VKSSREYGKTNHLAVTLTPALPSDEAIIYFEILVN